jgi:hypothetical protein
MKMINSKGDIPIAIDDHGRLIFIPKKEDPKIGIVGRKGMGMSWALHRFADCCYQNNRKIVILSDKYCKEPFTENIWPKHE